MNINIDCPMCEGVGRVYGWKCKTCGGSGEVPILVEEVVLQNDQEAKADAVKPRLSLVPTQIIYDIARVREYGDEKYGSTDNWKTVDAQRYVDAMFRHLLAFVKDPDGRDEESGLPHLWHLECNAAFLSEMMKGRWE